MKKTLLIAAAALAAGVISTQAQVYSQNVVGYYNITIPANSFALVGSQLINADVTNSVNNVLSSGLSSGQSALLLWNGTGYDNLTWYSAADAAPDPAGWYNGAGTLSAKTLPVGSGAFLQNPTASPVVIPVVGTVAQGSVTNTVASGFNIYAVNVPVSTNIDSTIVNFPATSGVDTLTFWTGSGFTPNLTYYNAADAAPSPAGWYDGGGTLQSTNAAYQPKVGQAFFVQHVGASTPWVSSYTVQ
jgi:hypothetical protein